MEKKVAIQELSPGMYVSRLDRPCVETTFLFQDFEIKDQTDIADLQRHYQKHAYNIAPTIDLMTEESDQEDQMLEIARSLDPGSYGIDPTAYFL